MINKVYLFEEEALTSNRNPGEPRCFELKLNIKLEESTQVLKMPVVAISSNCIQVTDDFVGLVVS